MVGDSHFDTALLQQAHLGLAGDATVDGDQEVRLDLRQALDGRRSDGVALLEAAGDERRDARAELAQAARHDGGGGDAVQVEIAEHEDVVAAADGGLKRIGGLGQPGDGVGVAPVAIERRREKTVRGFRGVDAARDERGRDEVRHVQLALQACDRLGLCRLDVESGRHGGYLLIAVLSYSSPLLSHKCMAAPPGSAAVGGQRGKLFGRRARMRCGSARGRARPRDAVTGAASAPYPLPRDAAPAAASLPPRPPRPQPRRSQLFCSLSPLARSLAQACDNGAFLP